MKPLLKRIERPRQQLFTHARLLDPASGMDTMGELLVERGKIKAVGQRIDRDLVKDQARVVDCEGMCLAPGLVDSRVFVGEPGAEHRETLASVSRAAAAGGVTSIVVMPDTRPVIDDMALVEFIRRTAEATSIVNVYPAAAMTRGLEGQQMTEIGLLKQAGAVAFSDGRNCVADAQLQRRALTYSADFNALVIAYCQDRNLAGSGVMHAGAVATRMGLAGIPREAEIIPLERDMRLVAMSGGRYHAATLSCAESVEVVAAAKKKGLDVTAGVAAANLALNVNDIGSYRTFLKLAPPLRSEDDRLALVEGVRSGVIDMICSNHDPQDADTKRHPFAEAADGAVGLETLLAATLRLHHTDGVALLRLIECLSTTPARRLGLAAGRIEKGARADLVLFDPEEPWVLQESDLHSLSKNTPFENARLQGRVLQTYVSGRKVYDRNAVSG